MSRHIRWVCSLALLLSACSRHERPECRIGINPWPGYEFLALAAEKGFFDSTVARFKVVELSSLSDAKRAFERGQVDAMAVTSVEVLGARAISRRRPVVVLVTDYSDGADVVIGRA